MSLDYNKFWKYNKKIKNLIKKERYLISGTDALSFYNLEEIGYPIELFANSHCIKNVFFLEQYRYNHGKTIEVEEGNIIIDAGSGWGDTSLYFASKVGSSGHVFSFEFIPNILNVLFENIDLNPNLKPNISVIKFPLWRFSNKTFNYVDQGLGSKIHVSSKNNINYLVKTISLDDFAEYNNLSKIDFIKMDIEGEELNALIGAKKIIIKYRPKLAICIYHHLKDYNQILKFIYSLNLNYNFYINHFTHNYGETVLFAIVDKISI